MENKKAKSHLPHRSLPQSYYGKLLVFFLTTTTFSPITHYCDSNKLRQDLQSKAWKLRSSGRKMRQLSAVYSPFAQANKIAPQLYKSLRLRKAKGETPIPKHSNFTSAPKVK